MPSTLGSAVLDKDACQTDGKSFTQMHAKKVNCRTQKQRTRPACFFDLLSVPLFSTNWYISCLQNDRTDP